MGAIQNAKSLLIKHLSEQQNVLKVVEECAELQEVLVKYLTKNKEQRPKMEKIIEEAGDVLFRIQTLCQMYGIEKQVQERVQEKAEVLEKWATEKFETFKN